MRLSVCSRWYCTLTVVVEVYDHSAKAAECVKRPDILSMVLHVDCCGGSVWSLRNGEGGS